MLHESSNVILKELATEESPKVSTHSVKLGDSSTSFVPHYAQNDVFELSHFHNKSTFTDFDFAQSDKLTQNPEP